MVSILSAKTKLQISKTKDPIAREYTINVQLGKEFKAPYYDFGTGVVKKLSDLGH